MIAWQPSLTKGHDTLQANSMNSKCVLCVKSAGVSLTKKFLFELPTRKQNLAEREIETLDISGRKIFEKQNHSLEYFQIYYGINV